MSKVEKYYNYIVKDMIENTEIDANEKSIKFPFSWRVIILPSRSGLTTMGMFDYMFDDFLIYVIGQYGINNNELARVWFKYLVAVEVALITKGIMWRND